MGFKQPWQQLPSIIPAFLAIDGIPPAAGKKEVFAFERRAAKPPMSTAKETSILFRPRRAKADAGHARVSALSAWVLILPDERSHLRLGSDCPCRASRLQKVERNNGIIQHRSNDLTCNLLIHNAGLPKSYQPIASSVVIACA
jgi:hypothetical protein